MHRLYLLPTFLFMCFSSWAQIPEFEGEQIFQWNDRSKVRPHKSINSQIQQRLSSTFTAYQVFNLNAEALTSYVANHHEQTQIRLVLSDQYQWQLNLESVDLLADDYQAVALTSQGRSFFDRPDRITYRGTVEGIPGSVVRLTLDGDHISGFIQELEEKIFIEQMVSPRSRSFSSDLLVYKEKDVQEDGDFICLERKVSQQEKRIEQKGAKTATMCSGESELRVATFATYDRYQAAGGKSAANNEILAILNNVQSNYDEYGVQIKLVEQVVTTCADCDPWSEPDGPSDLLDKFTDWAPSGFEKAHDDGICFYVGAGTGTVGVAWNGTICTDYHYAVVDKLKTSSTNRVLVAHEVGHNFSASHDADGSPYIMAPKISVTSEWSGESSNDIFNFLEDNTCLTCLEEEEPQAGCPSPSNLRVSDISPSEATLSWSDVSSARAYAVRVRRHHSKSWINFTAYENELIVGGLQSNTTYEWQILSSCSGEISSWTTGAKFSTSPESDAALAGIATLPWSAHFAPTTSQDGRVSMNSDQHMGTVTFRENSLVFEKGEGSWISEPVDISQISDVTMQVTIASTKELTSPENDVLEIEYRTDNNNWQSLYQMQETFTHQQLEGHLGHLSASSMQIRIKGVNHGQGQEFTIENVTMQAFADGTLTSSNKLEEGRLEDVQNQQDALIFPNPFHDELHLKWRGADTGENIVVKLFDLTGQLLWSKDHFSLGDPINIGSLLKPGAYVMQVRQGAATRQLKVIKQ